MGTAESNITVAIESKLLKKARAVAARRGRSVSALFAEGLHNLFAEDVVYEAARRNAQALLKSGYSFKDTKMINREEAHDRHSLR